jgi:Polysaccharide lyase
MSMADDIAYSVDVSQSTDEGHGDIGYGPLKFYRDKNPNGIGPTLGADTDGHYLRLAVAKGAYGKAADPADANQRDRCELRDDKLRLGTAAAYSFEMRVERGFPDVDARFVCAQIKAPYYDANGGSPLVALRIEHGSYFATIEHLYEPKDAPFLDGSEESRYLTSYVAGMGCHESARAFDHHVFGNSIEDFKEMQVRAVLATDRGGLPPYLDDQFLWCSSGVQVTQGIPLPDDIHRWWRFTMRLAATDEKDTDGVVQLLVGDPGSDEDHLVASATGELGHVGYADPAINTGPPPDTAHQYFKIGPYRDKLLIWGDAEAAIHVRNIQRKPWDEGEETRRSLRNV